MVPATDLTSRSPRGGACASRVVPSRPVSRRSPPIATRRTLGFAPTSCEIVSTSILLPSLVAAVQLRFALELPHRLLGGDLACGQLIQDAVPLFVPDSICLGANGEPQGTDYLREPQT